jgi:hypothetical protein
MRNRKSLILILLASILFIPFIQSQSNLDTVCVDVEYQLWADRDSQTITMRLSNGDSLTLFQHVYLWDEDSMELEGVNGTGELPGNIASSIFNPRNGIIRAVWDDPTANFSSLPECGVLWELRFKNTTGRIVSMNLGVSTNTFGFLKANGVPPIKFENCCFTSKTTSLEDKEIRLLKNPISRNDAITFEGEEVTSILLFNNVGQYVGEYKLNQFEASDLNPGLYLVIPIIQGEYSSVIRLIIN